MLLILFPLLRLFFLLGLPLGLREEFGLTCRLLLSFAGKTSLLLAAGFLLGGLALLLLLGPAGLLFGCYKLGYTVAELIGLGLLLAKMRLQRIAVFPSIRQLWHPVWHVAPSGWIPPPFVATAWRPGDACSPQAPLSGF